MYKTLHFIVFLFMLWLASFSATNAQQTFIRINDNVVLPHTSNWQHDQSFIDLTSADSICSLVLNAWQGQTAPNTNGGMLNPLAFFNPSTINSSGRIAFNSHVDGSSRNQGVFVADSGGIIYPIAIGCGGSGGSGDTTSFCGDPSPIGGTFGGFFLGTVFTPDINDSGDVLFFCDVNGGSSKRGLFLYVAATQEIIKVAVVGDPSPIGGIFNAVGPGSLNNNRKIVFLASPIGTITSNIFLWDNGVISKMAAVGDPAPGGGTFSLLGSESFGFQDGTNVPIGPVPDINDFDQISFRASVNGGITERGIIVRTNGFDNWYVKVPQDSTPAGGTYLTMQAAAINNAGQIAFLADYRPAPQTIISGWFAGAPGNWRKVIAGFDSLDGGQCLVLAYSRNPMQSIDEEGNVVFWADTSSNGGSDRLVLGMANGSLLIVARRGEISPNGGTIGSMDAWPSVDALRGTLNSGTPGGTGSSAHMVFSRCLVVPVELIFFTASVNGSNVILDWSTAAETNNQGFEIQKRFGQEFVTVGFIEGHGTTTEPKSYSYIENGLEDGRYTYRLKQIDYNGSYEYSSEVEIVVSTPKEFALEQNYPNPFNPSTIIKFSIPVTGNVKLAVYNLIGEEVAVLVNGQVEAGSHEITFDASRLSSGMYLYKLQSGNLTEIKKMILVR